MATNTNTIKTRIQLKSDTEENWNKAGPKNGSSGFIPLRGEIIIYSADDTHAFSRLKIGDGSTNVVDLPFIRAEKILTNDDVDDTNILIKTSTEWQNFYNYIAPRGTILVYVDTNTQMTRIKITDGSTPAADLPYVNQATADLLEEHIIDDSIHINELERTKWNNKITCIDTVQEHNLIFTRD